MFVPRPLRENANLAFVGEAAWAPALLNNFQAEGLLIAVNPSGRPNEDVLRQCHGWVKGLLRQRWQIDFPAHFTEAEVALYAEPAAMLHQRLGPTKPGERWWAHPQPNATLRIAIARTDRYLCTQLRCPRTDPSVPWFWSDSSVVPDETLLVVARDEDFTHGLLQSREFRVWWEAHASEGQPTLAFDCFPFPWSPRIPLGSLTALQQELRYNVARAARQEDAEQIRQAVSLAYGFHASATDEEVLQRLQTLNARRAY